jgi:hypothetical protein
LNKILITLQGRTLILYYQINQGLARKNLGLPAYIEVLPSDELSRYDLKGLTTEMFCVNIADMVNIRGQFSGMVENEKQIPIARWSLNHDAYLQAIRGPFDTFSHQKIVSLIAPLPGYINETDNQYIDFEERVLPHIHNDKTTFSGYRLTIVTEDIEGDINSYAYYNLDTYTENGWQGIPPPEADYEEIRIALCNKLQLIKNTGVQITKFHDETDYDGVP